MPTIELTEKAAAMMKQRTRSCLSGLRFDRGDTERKAFQEELKKKDGFLKKTLEHLPAA